MIQRFLILSLFILLNSSFVYADDSAATAITLNAGVAKTGAINPETDRDWYKFTLTENEFVEIKVEGSPSPYYRIHNSVPALIHSSQYGTEQYEMSPGTYYIEIYDSGANNEISSYTVSFKTTSSAGDQYEINNTLVEATPLTAGSSKTNSIIPANDEDWFKFTLTKNEFVEVTVDGSNTTYFQLYNATQASLASSQYGTRRYYLTPGTYYIRAYDPGYNSEISSYTVSFKTTSSAGDQYEVNNTLAEATPLTAGSPKTNSIIPANDEDWFKFTLTKNEFVEVTVDGSNTTYFQLYNATQASLASSQYGTRRYYLTPGAYYIRAYDPGYNSEISSYSVSLKTTSSAGDKFETDNVAADAKFISANVSQVRSIVPANDEDWIQFRLSKKDTVTLKTSGSSTPRITLFNSSLGQITSASYSGEIITELSAGTYYVAMKSNNSSSPIAQYTFQLTAMHFLDIPTPNSAGGFNVAPLFLLLLDE